jgi:hypothetical protein
MSRSFLPKVISHPAVMEPMNKIIHAKPSHLP